MTRPTLHLTVGLPGVGKTTLARKISHEDEACPVLIRRVDDRSAAIRPEDSIGEVLMLAVDPRSQNQ